MSIQERKKNPSAFLRNIFQILNNPDHAQTIHWAPQGNGFVIKDLPYFQANILPQFFKHKKYSSFVRQLNMYGFHKQRNSSFQNCFLHEQFKRGHELPTDIKRKPEKKKKMGEQNNQSEVKDGNWLSFSHQLRRHFPHIAENILLPSQTNKKKNIVLSSKISLENEDLSQSKMMEQPQQQGSQKYVSKISLKGFMEGFQEKSSKSNQKQVSANAQNDKNESEEQNSSYFQHEMNESLKNQSQSGADGFPDKRCFSFLKFKDDCQMLQSRRLSCQLGQNDQNLQKFNYFPAISLSFLDNNLQSLEGLGQVLVRQNEILQRAHSTIRNVVLKSQQNKISYMNLQLTSLQNTENTMNVETQKQNVAIKKVLQEQKQQITELTHILQQQIQGLTEFMLSDQDLPISTTSIKCRLQRIGSNKI